MVNSHDVARLAGVSQPTVSRVMRGSDKVSEATTRRVLEAVADLGYSPNAIGRALAVGHSNRVGLVVTDLQNQFYGHVIPHIHDELQQNGYELVLITESSEHEPIAEHAIANGLCGVVLTTTTVNSLLPIRLHDQGIPFVYFNRVALAIASDSVTVDPELGMRELAQMAFDLGHRHIGAIFGPRNTSTGEIREATLRAVLDDTGMRLDREHVHYGSFDFDSGFDAGLAILKRDDTPTLLVCGNDVIALGALNAAAQLDVSVPHEISIVGFDDLPTASWPLIQLTTIAYDLEEISREAGRMIVSRVEGKVPESPRTTEFPTRLVRRRTLGPART